LHTIIDLIFARFETGLSPTPIGDKGLPFAVGYKDIN
jgi:hypothetical protein